MAEPVLAAMRRPGLVLSRPGRGAQGLTVSRVAHAAGSCRHQARPGIIQVRPHLVKYPSHGSFKSRCGGTPSHATTQRDGPRGRGGAGRRCAALPSASIGRIASSSASSPSADGRPPAHTPRPTPPPAALATRVPTPSPWRPPACCRLRGPAGDQARQAKAEAARPPLELAQIRAVSPPARRRGASTRPVLGRTPPAATPRRPVSATRRRIRERGSASRREWRVPCRQAPCRRVPRRRALPMESRAGAPAASAAWSVKT